MLAIQEIINAIENHYHLEKGTLVGDSKHKLAVRARREAIYLIRWMTWASWDEIAEYFPWDLKTLRASYRVGELNLTYVLRRVASKGVNDESANENIRQGFISRGVAAVRDYWQRSH